MGQTTEDIYIPGAAAGATTSEVKRLRKWVRCQGMLIATLFFLLTCFAFIYFLNIPITGKQKSQSSMLQSAYNQKTLTEELMKKVASLEKELKKVEENVANITEAVEKNKFETSEVDKKAHLKIDVVNKTLTRKTRAVEESILSSNEQMQKGLKDIQEKTSIDLEKITPELLTLKSTVENLTEADTNLERRMATTQKGLRSQANATRMLRDASSTNQLRLRLARRQTSDLYKKLFDVEKNLTMSANISAEQLSKNVEFISERLENLKKSAANRSEMTQMEEELYRTLNHVTGNIQESVNQTQKSLASAIKDRSLQLENLTNALMANDQILSEVARSLAGIQNDVSRNLLAIERSTEAKISAVSDNVTTLGSKLEQDIKNVTEISANRSHDLSRRFGNVTEIIKQLQHTAANKSDELSLMRSELTERLEQVTGRIKTEIEKLGSKTNITLSDMSEMQDERHRNNTASLKNAVTSLEEFKQVLSQFREDAAANISNVINNTNTKLTAISTEVKSSQSSLATLQTELENLGNSTDIRLNEFSQMEKKRHRNITASLTNTMANLTEGFQHYVSNLRKDMAENISNVVNSSNKEILAVSEKVKLVETSLDTLQELAIGTDEQLGALTATSRFVMGNVKQFANASQQLAALSTKLDSSQSAIKTLQGLASTTNITLASLSDGVTASRRELESVQRDLSSRIVPELSILKRNLSSFDIAFTNNFKSLPGKFESFEQEIANLKVNITTLEKLKEDQSFYDSGTNDGDYEEEEPAF